MHSESRAGNLLTVVFLEVWCLSYKRYYTRFKSVLLMLIAVLVFVSGQRMLQNEPVDTLGIDTFWVLHDVGVNVPDESLLWQPGQKVGAGMVRKSASFKVGFSGLNEIPHISVTPAYLDLVEVAYFDQSGKLIKRQVKGSKADLQASGTYYDIDQLVFDVPKDSSTARIKVVAKGNLNVTLTYPTTEQLISKHTLGLVIKILVFFVIFLVVCTALVAGFWLKQTLLLVFGLHQFLWFLLLIMASNIGPSVWPHLSHTNGLLLGVTSIILVVTGACFHWVLLRNMLVIRWLSGVVGFVVLASVANLVVYLFVDQKSALISSASTTGLLAFGLVLFVPRRAAVDKFQGLIFKKISGPYAFVMLLVVLAAFSRLGFGAGLQTNALYGYALVTGMVLGQVLWVRTTILQRRQLNMASKAVRLSLANDKLSRDLAEQAALLSMLSHEIKTPLTTLSFCTDDSPQQEQIDTQLAHIRNVVDKVELMGSLSTDFESFEAVYLIDLIQNQWHESSMTVVEDHLIKVTSSGNINFVGNKLALEVIVNYLLSNARKYATNDTVLVTVDGGSTEHAPVLVQVQNECHTLSPLSVNLLTDKYYRAPNVMGVRGTGLGLWIVNNLCTANGYVLSLHLQDKVFTATVRLKR